MSPTGTAAADRTFLAHLGPWDVVGLRVGSLHGRERLSAPYRFDVRALTPEVLGPERIPPTGTPMTLALFTEDAGRHEPRFVHGLLTRTQHHGTDHDREGSWLGLRLEPRLVLLRRHRTRRVFQERTVAQIADMLLAPHRVPWRWAGELPTQRIAYAVQYDESDFDFLRRLLARFGVLFFFEQAARASGADAHETLVLCDDARHYAQLAPLEGTQPRTLHYAHGDARVRTDEALLSLEPVTRVRSTAVRLRDVDVRTPQQLPDHARGVETEAALGRDMLRVDDFEHRSGNDEVRFRPLEARVALEQARAGSVEVFGRTDCAALGVGTRFATGDHPLDALNAQWVVTELVHEGHVATLIPNAATGVAGTSVGYENRFRAVPANLTVRPARPARVLRQVCETAVVVGPTNEEVFTDALGRIKVQFHWDREGHYNEQSSCWVRVAQSLAGNGWGSQFLPRVGMEVLVTYVAGDVDHPLVTACLYNGSAAPPFVLPATRTRSGLRTRSSPGGLGYNELSFEDAAGGEQVLLRAQQDLQVVALRDHDRSVGHDERIEIANDRSLGVGRDRHTRVEREDDLHVGGSQSLSVSGARRERVEGDVVHSSGGDRVVSVAGHDARDVRGDAHTSVAGDRVTTIGGGYELLIEGGGSEDAHRGFLLRVSGPWDTTSTTTELVAAEGIVLRCGASRIELTPDAIRLRADRLELEGREGITARSDEASVALDRALHARAETVQLEAARGSELRLEAEAKLTGAKVSLGRAAAQSSPPGTTSTEGPIAPAAFQLTATAPDRRVHRSLVVLDGSGEEHQTLAVYPAANAPATPERFELPVASLPEVFSIAWKTAALVSVFVGPCRASELHRDFEARAWSRVSPKVQRRRSRAVSDEGQE